MLNSTLEKAIKSYLETLKCNIQICPAMKAWITYKHDICISFRIC